MHEFEGEFLTFLPPRFLPLTPRFVHEPAQPAFIKVFIGVGSSTSKATRFHALVRIKIPGPTVCFNNTATHYDIFNNELYLNMSNIF